MNLDECYALLWHLWLPLWSFKSQKCQTEIPQWREWTEEVQYVWVCLGHIFIMTRMTSRRESCRVLIHKKWHKGRESIYIPVPPSPEGGGGGGEYQTFFKNAIKPWAWLNWAACRYPRFHWGSLILSIILSLALTNWKWTFKPQALSTG